MKIVYCTWTDPYDKHSWSGIHYYMLKTLQKQSSEITVIGPLKNKFILFAKIIDKILRIFFKKNSSYLHSNIISKEFTRQLTRKLEKINADILFFRCMLFDR